MFFFVFRCSFSNGIFFHTPGSLPSRWPLRCPVWPLVRGDVSGCGRGRCAWCVTIGAAAPSVWVGGRLSLTTCQRSPWLVRGRRWCRCGLAVVGALLPVRCSPLVFGCIVAVLWLCCGCVVVAVAGVPGVSPSARLLPRCGLVAAARCRWVWIGRCGCRFVAGLSMCPGVAVAPCQMCAVGSWL